MILFLTLFILGFYDSYGVNFNDETKTILISAPNTITKYTVPAETEIISGGDGINTQIDSAFYQCKDTILELKFQNESKLNRIKAYGLSYLSKLKELDMSMCTKLTFLSSSSITHCESLSSIILPPNLEKIEGGDLSFLKISYLELPSSLQIIGGYTSYGSCLSGNYELKTFSWGSNPNISKIGSVALSYSGITSIFIPKSLIQIDSEVFAGCPITTISTDPDNPSFSTDGKFLFNKDQTSIKFAPAATSGIIKITDKITSLGSGAFLGTSIETIILTNNVESLGSNCFYNSKIQYLTIPSSVTSLGGRVFDNCVRLHTLTIEASVESIPNAMCLNCISLQKISFPHGLVIIGEISLSGCIELDYIFIPKTVTTINPGAFSNVNSTAIYDFEEGSPLRYVRGYLYNSDFTTIIAYIGGETDFTACINDSVKEIGSSAFCGISLNSVEFIGTNCHTISYAAFASSSIESFTVVSSIRTIADSAFSNCKKLKKLKFAEGIQTIGQSAFESTAISGILSFPQSLTKISDYAFRNTAGIVSLSLSQIQIIGREAFSGTGVNSVTISSYVKEIGWSAFAGNSLQIVNFEDRSQNFVIPERSFKGCTKLETVIFANGIVGIENFAFEGCTALKELNLGGDIINISSQTFKDCTGLTKISIPDNSGLENIETLAFEGCSNLLEFVISENHHSFSTEEGVLFDSRKTSIVLYLPAHPRKNFSVPETVEKIQICAFRDAVNLEFILLPETINTIEYGAFMGCTSLMRINIPLSIESIATHAFSGCSSLGCGSILYDPGQREMLEAANAPKEGLDQCPTGLFSVKKEIAGFSEMLYASIIDMSESE